MSARVPGVEDRSLLPRWRTFSRSAPELGSAKNIHHEPIHFLSLDEAAEAFTENPGFFTAGDLLAQAATSGQDHTSVQAARDFMLSTDEEWLDAARRAALASHIEEPEPIQDEKARWRVRVHQDREILSREPRNAIRWTDLALAHLNLGNQREAQVALRVAADLAPSNRYVLRSLARFASIYGDPAEARRRLVRSDSLDDPWLLAADLSLSDVMGVTPRNLRKARAMAFDDSIPSEHLTELRGALAKVDLGSGSVKRATELTRLSLLGATENSLAQAEWARHNGIRLRAEETSIGVRNSFEASSRSLMHQGDFEHSLIEAQSWLRDQPFAPEPAIYISWLAVATVDSPEIAVRAAKRGLVSSPDDWTLRNNLVVALLLSDEHDAAAQEFTRLDSSSLTANDRGIYDATLGMLQFRMNDAQSGRQLYQNAILRFQRGNDPVLAAIASLFWAREEARISSDSAPDTWATAERLSARSNDLVVERLHVLVAEAISGGSVIEPGTS